MTESSRFALYAGTAAHLRPVQLVHRVRLRVQRAVESWLPEALWDARRPFSRHQWPHQYVPLDGEHASGYPSPEDNILGTFKFLEEDRRLGRPADWRQREASLLWRYHLHYLEWAWSFARHPDREWARYQFEAIWRSWHAGTKDGRGVEWSPYVASLRAWVMCGVFDVLVRDGPIEEEFLINLGRHVSFLRTHIEHDVGGNHILKNLKALVGLGVFFGDDYLVESGLKGILRQLPIQILTDGGHFERSPSYHCQVLGDLLDVSNLLTAAGNSPVPELQRSIDSMRSWLGAMLLPDGDVPLFNDCVLVGSARIQALGPHRAKGPVTVLHPSGYVVIQMGRVHFVADVGAPCPPDLPAHAHADALSFVLAVDGERLFVDTGTSTYGNNPRRGLERSTAAHNTVELDGADQSEVWAVFRAARLARVQLESVTANAREIEVIASHDGYRRLRGKPIHRRTWRLSEDSLYIEDEVSGKGIHCAVARLHIAAGIAVSENAGRCITIGPIDGSVSGASVAVDSCEVSTQFGQLHLATVVTASAAQRLPILITTQLSLRRAAGGSMTVTNSDHKSKGSM